jgi:hypothetical protein
MEKKEFPKEKIDLRPKVSGGMTRRTSGIIKFILGVFLLPFVYSLTISFLNEFSIIEKPLQNNFWAGVISFLLIYLFVWEPAKIYLKGQKLLEVIFRFFAPLVRIAPYLLPIFFILIFIGYLILAVLVKSDQLLNYSIFLFGFTIALHLVFSAKSLRLRQGDFLKANYIFGFSFIYIINLILLSFFLNIIFAKFSIVNFLNYSFQTAKEIFGTLFKQFFL